jgi:predicted nucleic acid-binding protein
MNRYMERQLLSYCDIEGSVEAELYVKFAVQLDDGEAACLAIAKSRSWIMATDDRVARRMAMEQSVKVLGTPEIVRTWAECNCVSDGEIALAIGNIQRFAKYTPRANGPDSDWWYRKQGTNDT